jgi:hypothetical protein
MLNRKTARIEETIEKSTSPKSKKVMENIRAGAAGGILAMVELSNLAAEANHDNG